MQPTVPGAWQWLGPRALQFRPADAWKPLQRVVITSEGRSARLIPLLPTPVSTSPSDQSQGIANLDQIAMTFGEPVEVRALARLLRLEVRPSPGIDTTGGQMLTAQDFDIRPMERARRVFTFPSSGRRAKTSRRSGGGGMVRNTEGSILSAEC